jgi:hypothetical protein
MTELCVVPFNSNIIHSLGLSEYWCSWSMEFCSLQVEQGGHHARKTGRTTTKLWVFPCSGQLCCVSVILLKVDGSWLLNLGWLMRVAKLCAQRSLSSYSVRGGSAVRLYSFFYTRQLTCLWLMCECKSRVHWCEPVELVVALSLQ